MWTTEQLMIKNYIKLSASSLSTRIMGHGFWDGSMWLLCVSFSLFCASIVLAELLDTRLLHPMSPWHTHLHWDLAALGVPNRCQRFVTHQQNRVTANAIRKTKNTQSMGDSLAVPSLPKVWFLSQTGQKKLYLSVSHWRPKCATSTSILAVLAALDACRVSQCWPSTLLVLTTKIKGLSTICKLFHAWRHIYGNIKRSLSIFFRQKLGRCFGKTSLAPVGARVLELLDVLLSSNPGGWFNTCLAVAFSQIWPISGALWLQPALLGFVVGLATMWTYVNIWAWGCPFLKP